MRRELEKAFVIKNSKIYRIKKILVALREALKRLIFFLLGFFGYLSFARLYFC